MKNPVEALEELERTTLFKLGGRSPTREEHLAYRKAQLEICLPQAREYLRAIGKPHQGDEETFRRRVDREYFVDYYELLESDSI